jgi:hypothetical protein
LCDRRGGVIQERPVPVAGIVTVALPVEQLGRLVSLHRLIGVEGPEIDLAPAEGESQNEDQNGEGDL